MRRRLLAARLLALFAAALLLFDHPLVGLWLGSALGTFAVWALVIALLALLMEAPERD